MKKYLFIAVLFILGFVVLWVLFYTNTPALQAGTTGAFLEGNTQSQADCTGEGTAGPCDTNPCPEGQHFDEQCNACVDD